LLQHSTFSALQVAIIGGGIAGLAAAYELAARGIPFVLLEASERLGGLVRTDRVDGCTIDAGADSMLATKPAAIELCEELGLGPQLMTQTPPRTAFVYARGSLHPLPSPSVFGIPTTPEGLAAYTLLPPSARDELESRQRGAVPAGPGGDESVADFFARHFGPDTVGLIAEPLLGGIHAGDIARLSIDAVAPAFATRVRAGQLFAPTTPSARTDDGMFKALRGGMGALVSAIEGRLPTGSIRRSSGARTLARSGHGWRVGCDGASVDARSVVLACPAYAAAGLLHPIDAPLADLCAGVPYASTVSVALVWPRADVPHPLAGSGFVVARRHSDLRITACTWVSSKWQDRAGPGAVLLRAFLGGIADPHAVALSDGELIDVAVRDLRAVLDISAPPRTARVYRWIRAGAQHNVGHVARVADIEARLARHPGLFAAGSGFTSIGVPDCVADGRAVARRASDTSG
jgi:oxygen-dependent protoporphyrinogen oxidase